MIHEIPLSFLRKTEVAIVHFRNDDGHILTSSLPESLGSVSNFFDVVSNVEELRSALTLVPEEATVPVRLQCGETFFKGKLFRSFTHGETIAVLNDHTEEHRLEALHHAKNEWIAVLCHELRNPLNSIQHSAMLVNLCEPTLSKTARSEILAINDQVKLMARLINDLTDLARHSEGKVRIERKRVSVDSVMQQAITTMRPPVKENNHTLIVHEVDPSLTILADRQRLHQILVNLLSNSCKYTKSGGIINFSATKVNNSIQITVQDTGIGISPELLPHIFDMFVQGNSQRGGLGIGLCLVKNLVDLHGGSISVNSTPGEGTTFVVTLPIAPSPHILVLEDSSSLLSKLLLGRGYSVDTSLSHDMRYDTLIVDVDAIQRRDILNLPPDRKFIFVGQHKPEDLPEGRFLKKPVDVQQLTCAIYR